MLKLFNTCTKTNNYHKSISHFHKNTGSNSTDVIAIQQETNFLPL